MSASDPVCIGCKKQPHEIEEYVDVAIECEITPAEFVRQEEVTFNPHNGHFLCTACYVLAGMPSSPRGWMAP